jgi:hypothetical protein
MPFITGLNVHPSVPCYPGTARRQGLSGEKEGSILLFGAVWVFFGDVFGLVNQIIMELTQGCTKRHNVTQAVHECKGYSASFFAAFRNTTLCIKLVS